MTRPNTWIKLGDDELRGTPEFYPRTSPEVKVVRRQWPGIPGESEILLGQSGRTLRVPFVLHDDHQTAQDVADLVDKWQAKIGTVNATLIINSAHERTYQFCSIDLADQVGDILPGLPGTVGIQGYWTRMFFVFRQLAIGGLDAE